MDNRTGRRSRERTAKIARSRSEHEWSVDLSYLHTVFGLTITEESGSKRAQYGKTPPPLS